MIPAPSKSLVPILRDLALPLVAAWGLTVAGPMAGGDEPPPLATIIEDRPADPGPAGRVDPSRPARLSAEDRERLFEQLVEGTARGTKAV